MRERMALVVEVVIKEEEEVVVLEMSLRGLKVEEGDGR